MESLGERYVLKYSIPIAFLWICIHFRAALFGGFIAHLLVGLSCWNLSILMISKHSLCYAESVMYRQICIFDVVSVHI